LYILHDKHAIHGISGKTIDRILFSTCMYYYTGMLHEGDEILEVNGIDMKGKNINDVSEMLVSISTCFLGGLILRTYIMKVFTQLEPISQFNSLPIARPSQICNVL
jgi:hypothetical protein